MNSELDTILIKVASRCNINCTYCYVYNMGDDNWSHQKKFMSAETIHAVCESLSLLSKRQKKIFSVILHGGEPFLIGPEKLQDLLSQLRSVLPFHYPVSIQTNGILINEVLLDICSMYHASVAVSIDGPEHVHNKNRISHQGAGTFEDVLRGISLLQNHPDASFLNAGLLAVIDPLTDAAEVYHFFKTLAPASVDFLYKDGNHSRLPLSKSSLHSIEYGGWMKDLLDIYLADPNPLPIRILDDMLKVILGGLVSKEGMGITDFGILIIDTDGTIMKNDTLKSSFNGADKFTIPTNIKDKKLAEFLLSQEFQDYRSMQRPTNSKCINCPELNICGGGMILHRWSNDNGFDNPSVYCADQLFLINNMRKKIKQLMKIHA